MPRNYKTYRVMLDITVDPDFDGPPDSWDWYNLLEINGSTNNLEVVNVAEIQLNQAQVNQMNENLGDREHA